MTAGERSFAGRYFVEFAGRSKHNLPFPVVARYGRIVGRVEGAAHADLYAVECYEFGSPEVSLDNVTGARIARWRLFDEWRGMKLWLDDVYMPTMRAEVVRAARGA